MTDDELVRAWAGGDDRAGRELFDRHYPALFRFFRNKTSRGIQDLVQDTMLGCVKGVDRLIASGSFKAYLFGTARNVLKQHYRRTRRKDDPVDFGTHSVADLGAGHSTVLGQRREHRLLLEALRRLPVETQITLELYMWEDLTGPELAAVLEITEPAVRSRIHRAKERLREEMESLRSAKAVLESTQMDLDEWARQIRDLLEREGRAT